MEKYKILNPNEGLINQLTQYGEFKENEWCFYPRNKNVLNNILLKNLLKQFNIKVQLLLL